jgi:phenylalanyl-tRNA synthetase alpha chain
VTYTDIAGRLELLVTETEAKSNAASARDELDELERSALGRRGELGAIQRSIGELASDERPKAGQLVQDASARMRSAVDDARARLSINKPSIDPQFDPTIPGYDAMVGGLHPTVQMMYDVNDAFEALNFDIYSGPEISDERYEFDYMNFPPEHPARETMDTYWLTKRAAEQEASRLCLRPHLTGASVRYMQTHPAPHRFAYPGRVYRNESTDARHERAFFQYEALITAHELPFTAGKLLVQTILSTVFGRDVRIRMRTGYFPFVEPGFEIDMECQVCHGTGCALCKGVGWLEVMPGGIPHPNVLRAGGLDPNEWTGFYINIGLDRLVMMRYGIDDVRLFNSADLRFLAQFK